MQTSNTIAFIKAPPENCQILGLGVFDGLHTGHQHIVSQCDAVLSFHPHPDIVLKKNSNLNYLTNAKERHYISSKVSILEFNETIASLEAITFLETIIKPLNPQTIIVGYDFKFGAKRKGNFQLLKKWAKALEIKCIEVAAIKDSENTIIKSSNIRELLLNNPDKAIRLLGHPYIIINTVKHGDKRGRTLGYPTANITIESQKAYPKPGVYYGKVIHNNISYNAGIYIGYRNTFGKSTLSLEVHILNFSKEIYNEELIIEIYGYVRDDQKFNSEEDLKHQIDIDIQNINSRCQTIPASAHDANVPDQFHQSHP